MLDIFHYTIFQDNISTLKENSRDDNGECMTESLYQVINFDAVKREYTKNLHITEEKASSVDAVARFSKDLVFIEFKNGNNINKQDLRNKARDSLLIFLDITKGDLSYSRNNIDLIIVYNETIKPITKEEENTMIKENAFAITPPSFDNIVKNIYKYAKKELVRFGLDRFQQIFFRSVHTYSKREFEIFLQNKLKIS